ncbi:hypothetical protein EZS27_020555 [termite gut metagenome]|uniref:Uncharacterized protein n=1 Tax=termite gut metagenome TaxID=433724 RepID=A0A5J4RAI5_9ZZZZ
MENLRMQSLFPDEKGQFNWNLFENNVLNEKTVFALRNAFSQANDKINGMDFTDFKRRTIAGTLNDIVTKCVEEEFKEKIIGTVSNLHERFICDIGNYIFIFKKFPVSNIETVLSSKINNQDVSAHIITVVYNNSSFKSLINY